VPLIIWAPKSFASRRVREPASLADLLPTLVEIGTTGKTKLARAVDGRSLYPLLAGAPENPDVAVIGEYLAEGVVAPMYMIRRERWKFIHCPGDPDQLFDIERDPNELHNLAAANAGLAKSFRAEIEAKFDLNRIASDVLQSQQARHMMFEALRRGEHFPWDFQPLRDASEQYTRNHMSVTDRDLQSRYPKAPDIASKKR
jgi:choline-sulfatase